MRVNCVNLPFYETYSQFLIIHLTDLHLGARACNEHALKSDIEWIAKQGDNVRVILGGDLIDCHSRNHIYYLESTHAEWLRGIDDVILEEIQRLTGLLAPISDKIDAYIAGNHENNALKFSNRNVYQHIAIACLGNEYHKKLLGYNGFLSYSFKYQLDSGKKGYSWRMNTHITHGSGGGRTVGSSANFLQRQIEGADADLYFAGHQHKSLLVTRTIDSVTNKGKYEQKQKVAIMSPSYLERDIYTHEGESPIITYPQLKDLPAQIIGSNGAIVSPMQRALQPAITNGLRWSQIYPNGFPS